MQDWNNLWLDLTNSVIHTVLYIHHVYPIDTFERCERYGVPVYYCQSALVRDYLEPLLLDIRNYFSKGLLRSIRVSLLQHSKEELVNYQMQMPMLQEKPCTLDCLLQWQDLFRNTIYKIIYIGQSSSLSGVTQLTDCIQQRWETLSDSPFAERTGTKNWEILYSCEIPTTEQSFYLFREEMDPGKGLPA